MIRQKEVINLMEGTIPFTKRTLSSLSDLITTYPYFQTGHLLYTLNLLHLKDAHFLYDLRKTAVYVPDRKQLFFRIETDFFESDQMGAFDLDDFSFDSPFELIDNFLSEGGENRERDNSEQELTPVITDYTPYFIPDDDTENEEAPPLEHQETIDRFLEEDAISPLKINVHSADVSAKETLEHAPDQAGSDSFFSETLAKIYIKQKKYDKALEIIHKLNLIYPEKSRYFADQIRFLEKLIIYTNKTN